MKPYSILTKMTMALFAFCVLVIPALPARADWWLEGPPRWWWKYVYPGGNPPPHWAHIVRFDVEYLVLPSGAPGYEVTFAMQNQSDSDYRGGDSWQIKGFCDPSPQPWRPAVLGEGRLPAIQRGKIHLMRIFVPGQLFNREGPRLLMLVLNDAPDTVRLTGRISLQGSEDLAQKVHLKFLLGDGSVAYATETHLDAYGRLLLPAVPAGFQKVAIKGEKWLQKVILNDDIKPLEAMLLAGDANDDNFCDVADLHQLIRSFDSMRGEELYDPGADLNCNGFIDVDDLALIIRNFDSMGDA